MERFGPALACAALLVTAACVAAMTGVAGGQFGLVGVPFVLVGAFLMLRRRGGNLGVLQALIGVLVVSGATSAAVAIPQVTAGRPPTPTIVAMAWYGEWYWVPWLYLLLAGVPLFLPTGELRSPLARQLWRVVVIGGLLATSAAMFQRQLLIDDVATPLANPVGWLPYADVDRSPVGGLVVFGAVALGAAATLAVVRRYRRSVGIERQQLKIVTAGAVASIAMFVLNIALQNPLGVTLPDWTVGLMVGAVPASILLAVLRYRLFEIDRLLSRTVTYVMVSAAVVGVYSAVTVIPSAVFDLQSDVIVAAATLAAAGVFVPVRRRAQLLVDRRFNRARYDAAVVSDRFAERLRHHVDLDTLADDLTGVLVATVQPTHVTLWLSAEPPR